MVDTMVERWSTGRTARELDVSQVTVRQFVRRGVLQATETPLGLLFDPRAVEQLAEARRQARQEAGREQ